MALQEMRVLLILLAIAGALAQTNNNGTVAMECRIVPSAGSCRPDQRRNYWSYSSKTSSCIQMFGCYSVRDRNVFLTKSGCESNCFVTGRDPTRPAPVPGVPGLRIAQQCRLNPSPGRCEKSQIRTFWSYSGKTGTCIQVTGCYTLSDRNIFLSRDQCRRGCFIRSNTGNANAGTPVTLPATVPEQRPDSPVTLPSGMRIDPECRLNPTAGACKPNGRRNWFSFSAKTGNCVQIYGCYEVRDRNVFMDRNRCMQKCLISDSGTGQDWKRDPQCYLNPTPGRCAASERRSFWSYSSKLKSCTQIYGCYGLRDRNVFQTQDSCSRMCVGNQMLPEVPEKFTSLQGVKIALECRINPSPGRCTNGEKRTFYSYSSKTGDCAQIFGCYGIRDRNVFLSQSECRRGCFISESDSASGMEPQCYINPSAGRCAESQKTRYWTYTAKTGGCVQIYGCYSIRDRNVFLSQKGCREACASSSTLPVRPEGQVNIECTVNPTPGRCRDSAKRQYYSYSSKTGSCTPIFGCYGLRDRNVFMTLEGCNNNCFVTGGTTKPSGERDKQCFLVPSPGRCLPNQRRAYYSYSPKVDNCAQITGCYSIRDRNVFVTRKSCTDTCGLNATSTNLLSDGPVAFECQLNPSPGNCRESEKRRYYSYSSKTRRCTQIYGCYSIRDRNVFLTEGGCRQNCFKSGSEVPSGEMDKQCLLVPAQGRCRENEKTNYWSYSPKIGACAQIFGCYSFRDRNVFITRDSCRQTCAVNQNATYIVPNNDRIAIECRVNPSPGQCRPGDTRRYYSYSSKTGSCVQIDGCYSIRDRNVFVSRQNCRQNCFISDGGSPSTGRDAQCYLNPAAGVCLESQKQNFWSYSPKIDACTQIYGCYSVRDRNIFMTRDQCGRICDTNATIDVPLDNATVAIECLVNPSPGNCRENQRTRYYSYNAKLGVCTQIYGCYSIRDRNVFVTENGCKQNCFVSDTNRPSGGRDNQCYLTPSPGRCMESQKRSYWTFSSKIEACTQIYGCYSLRDRNVYMSRPSCQQMCAVDNQSAFITDPRNITVARECRVNPSPGVCRDNERTRYFTFSSKTNTCTQIYGCYSIRDRNVFLTRENCRQNCFVTDGGTPSGDRDNQCYINPSPSRCRENERRTYWTFSSKVEGCVQIFGCYSPRDRNVYITRPGCEQTCAVDTSIVIPDRNNSLAIECRLNPTPGNCRDNERTRYYTYSGKTGTCIQIFGCYSIRDRNVFLTRQSCRQNCFLSDGGRPTDRPDNQCFLNPTPGQCMPSERRTYWTYSSKTGGCERIYGCYSIRDRNVYITQNSCEQMCMVYIPTTTMMPPTQPPTIPPTTPPTRVAVKCLFNPSPGICREVEKRQFYSYSTKTETCVPIYGCYGLRDRNVFRTRENCNRNCFITGGGQPSTEKERQCFINPSPGRCNPSDRRTFFTYSSKTASCVQIYGCYSVRDRNVFLDRGGCRRACVNGDFSQNGDLQALTDITSIRLEDGLRLSRECQINPTPGLCSPRQERTFWSFSTKTMGCTRITGCYDIHDRNTWLTQDGCARNCFKNDSAPVVPGITPLECQLNPTPGRCLPSERRTYWSYNNKLNTCRQITGCYDFHDRNVWANQERCQTKCRVSDSVLQPLMPGTNLDTVIIAKECHVNPSPGRCLESEKLTYWTFSMKTGSCLRIRGCYSIRDRNTWLTKESCRSSCIIMDPNKPTSDKIPLGCRLIPTPGRCIESQRKLVWTYSEKLGACIEIIGCYDFHDRNVWRTRENCNEQCHVTAIPMFPDMTEYDVDLECQLNPSPGMCRESEQRSYYAFSTKAMTCVEIYGCYTMNDRNVWFSRRGCLNNCLVPTSGNSTDRPVAAGCRITPSIKPCRPGQRTNWWTYDESTDQCINRQGCYRLGDRNVFINKQRCEYNCFRKDPQNQERRECYLNPSPGVCRDDERRIYWSYNKKTSTCMRVEGCYSIRDRNVWLTENMCKNTCMRPEITPSGALPDFMSSASIPRNGNDFRGRRGKVVSRNMQRTELNAPNDGFMRIITADNMRSVNTGRDVNAARTGTQTVNVRGVNAVRTGTQTVNVRGVNAVRTGTQTVNVRGVNAGRTGTQTLTGSQSSVAGVSRNQNLMSQMPGMSEARSNSVRVVQVSGSGSPRSKVVTSLFRT